MSALIVNLFGGPGAGKSTLASGAFYTFKREGMNFEFVHEFAKELAWEKRQDALQNQVYILGNQMQMYKRCAEQVECIITDTSILYGTIYDRKYNHTPYPEEFEALVLAAFRSMRTLNFYVERIKPYNPVGRYQDEEDAKDIDKRVRAALVGYRIPYLIIPGTDVGMHMMVEEIRRCLNNGIVDGPMQPDLFGGETPTRIEK